MVYLIIDKDKKYCKIGFSDCNPDKRLQALIRETKLELSIYHVIVGSRGAENYMHKRFSKHWIKREWFWYSEDIIMYFDKCYNDSENVQYRASIISHFSSHKIALLSCLSAMIVGDNIVIDDKLNEISFYTGYSIPYIIKLLNGLSLDGKIKAITLHSRYSIL